MIILKIYPHPRPPLIMDVTERQKSVKYGIRQGAEHWLSMLAFGLFWPLVRLLSTSSLKAVVSVSHLPLSSITPATVPKAASRSRPGPFGRLRRPCPSRLAFGFSVSRLMDANVSDGASEHEHIRERQKTERHLFTARSPCLHTTYQSSFGYPSGQQLQCFRMGLAALFIPLAFRLPRRAGDSSAAFQHQLFFRPSQIPKA